MARTPVGNSLKLEKRILDMARTPVGNSGNSLENRSLRCRIVGSIACCRLHDISPEKHRLIPHYSRPRLCLFGLRCTNGPEHRLRYPLVRRRFNLSIGWTCVVWSLVFEGICWAFVGDFGSFAGLRQWIRMLKRKEDREWNSTNRPCRHRASLFVRAWVVDFLRSRPWGLRRFFVWRCL